MKNRNEMFIKYFDEQLSKSDKETFEAMLLSDDSLKKEYELFVQNYIRITKNIELEETYFNTLIPNSLSKIRNSKRGLSFKIAYVFPFIIILIFYLFYTDNNRIVVETDLNNLITLYLEDENRYEKFIIDDYNSQNSYQFDNVILNDIIFEETDFDESLFDYLRANVREDDISETLFNQFNESEFNSIYNELVKRKIIGAK